MKDFKFKLTTQYCLLNGICILEQIGSKITFLIENKNNLELKEKITNAFLDFVNFVKNQSDFPKEYLKFPKVHFEKSNKKQIRKFILQQNKNEFSLENLFYEICKKNINNILIKNNKIIYKKDKQKKYLRNFNKAKIEKLIHNINSFSHTFVYSNEKTFFIKILSSKNSHFIKFKNINEKNLPINILGFNDEQTKIIKNQIKNESGLTIICGPSFSGKTTTGLSIINQLDKQNKMRKKIICLKQSYSQKIGCSTDFYLSNKSINERKKVLEKINQENPDILLIDELTDKNSLDFAVRSAFYGRNVILILNVNNSSEVFDYFEKKDIPFAIIKLILNTMIYQELSEIEQFTFLYSDVCVPNPKIDETKDFDEHFYHFSNYKENHKNTLNFINLRSKNGIVPKIKWNSPKYSFYQDEQKEVV